MLVFLHVDSRRVFATPASFKPDAVWMREQAEAFVAHVKDSGLEADIVMHDRDGKFNDDFDQTLRDADLRVQKAAYRSPNTVAFVERFIQTLQQECLDYFFVFGERHMNHLVREVVAYAGGPAWAVPLVLIPVDALHEGQKYSVERARKYLARLKQLTADDVLLWKDEVDQWGGTSLDAAVNIILLDDYFDKKGFQRGKFKAAIGAREK